MHDINDVNVWILSMNVVKLRKIMKLAKTMSGTMRIPFNVAIQELHKIEVNRYNFGY